jgi:hypothetical protein
MTPSTRIAESKAYSVHEAGVPVPTTAEDAVVATGFIGMEQELGEEMGGKV